MIRNVLFTLVCLLGTTLSRTASAQEQKSLGVINFATCISESKLGKQEQASFESMKQQITKSLEDLEKQITEISAKLNDREYLDSLSPQAEEEMKTKFRTLNDDLARNQNQYYQLLNQANLRILQLINTQIIASAENIAKEKKLSLVMNKEALFFYAPTMDITSDVIVEMDRQFDAKKAEAEKAQAAKETSTEDKDKGSPK
ncbi:MAG: hypothetical protein A3E26_05345 [Chlamydiae bacterium RIFCSPHIGHO2_12_FULL_49_32]|nr:MAG: hypothetical protein A3D18_01590 [Chlamydiae bacterium RIFCSPHIGHO2_02_FULL_49_29]OGN63268.1 MAG: hypothetical protein A3E26_05345 [Chlamydiae bacterium RIFCSPHIGHO2_12_FULL_49_32]OGN67820.1 MAG: hypothetical protein A3I15_03770 [Chlamydiae bacterium RIFCSPLOWO2_02_FULL_49_12]